MKGFFSSSTVQKDKPAGLIPKCGSCGLFKTCESPKMKPYGDGAKRILVVGEAPGGNEDEDGRPFVGKAGRLLRETLQGLGVNLDRDAITTNALICRPPKNATPDVKQISYCRPNLLNTIREFEPRVIVTLGRSALVSVLHDYWGEVGPMERWAGWQIPLEQFWICPTFHPSYLLRMRNQLMDRLFESHLEAAFNITKDPPKQPEWRERIEIIYEDNKVYDALGEIDSEGGWAVVDYETNCIKPEYPEAKIFSCAVSNGRRTISYPWTGSAIGGTARFLQSKRTKKISSNLKFEERWTKKQFGHGVANWGWDTMIAAHCLDNRQGICSLKFQAFVKLGVPSYNDHIEPYLENHKGHYNRIGEIDIGQLMFYGGMDAILEYRLAMKQRREMGYGD